LAVDRFAGSEPRVVVVHGVLDRAATFRRFARALAPLEVVLYDRRGYARSRDMGPATFTAHLADLRAVVGREHATVVVGHSLGGTLALALASDPPPTLRGVSVFEAPLPTSAWWGPWAVDPRSVLAGEVPEPDLEELVSDFLRRAMGPALAQLGPNFLAERRAEAPAFTRELAELAAGEVAIDLDRISVPVQAGIGELAGTRHRRGLATLMASIDAEAYCVRGAPHGVHLSAPAAWAEAVRDFIRRLD